MFGWLRPKIFTVADLPPAFWTEVKKEQDRHRKQIADAITESGWNALAAAETGTPLNRVYRVYAPYREDAH